MVKLLDLIDKLELDQKLINDFNRENIFYVYELLEINPNKEIGKYRPINLTKKQKNDIRSVLNLNNLRYVYELDENEKEEYYNYLNSLWEEKKGKEIESLDIDFFDFPVRVRNGLVRSGIDSLFKLSKVNIKDLYGIRNLGTSSIPIILETIHKLGIYLHGEDISKINKINTVVDTYEKIKDRNLFLIEEAKEVIERKSQKQNILDMTKKIEKIVTSESISENEMDNQLITHMYMILEVLKDNENKEKVEAIEELLKSLYHFDKTEIKKLIKNND